jgi:hypothetical protein
MLQVLPIESILKSNILRSLIPCVGPEIGLKVRIAKDAIELEKLKEELEAQAEEK